MGGLTGAVCVPSRACLHTGAHVFNASAGQEMSDHQGLMTLPSTMPLLAEQFRAAGYQTFATGKWHNDRAAFARSFGAAENIFFGGMCDHHAVPLHQYDPDGLYPQAAARQGDGFSTDLFADAAQRFLQQHAGAEPFFLYLSFTAPHDPRTPPPRYAHAYDACTIDVPPNFAADHPFDNGELRCRDEELAAHPRTVAEVQRHIADYYGMISHMDARIGTVLDTLAAQGFAENTIVVYMADHGIAIGQHGLLGKQNMYDHSIRVPMILRGPGIPANRQSDALLYAYDIHATLLELCGLESAAQADSRSLVPVLNGTSDTGRASVYSLYRDVQRAVTDGEWKLIRYYQSALTGAGSERLQLFNLVDDPWEIKNRAEEPAMRGILTQSAAALTDWMARVGDPLAAIPVIEAE